MTLSPRIAHELGRTLGTSLGKEIRRAADEQTVTLVEEIRSYSQPAEPVATRVGYQELILGVTPAAGQSYRYRVPGDWSIQPLSVLARLTTSAVVGERSLTLEYQDASDTRYLVAGVQATLAASQVQSFCWHPLAGDVAWPVDDCAIAPLPQQMIFPAFSLVLKIGNADAADQLDSIRLVLELFPTGQS